MKVRVVTSPPWDVAADLLCFPVSSEDGLDGELGELDRRLGGALGEYRRLGEMSGKAHASVLLQGRDTGAPWLLGMGIGENAGFTRVAALRLGGALERRLKGRHVERMAIFLPSALGDATATAASEVAELVTRGVVEGNHEPASIYRESVDDLPPELAELTLVCPDGDVTALTAAAERGRVIGE